MKELKLWFNEDEYQRLLELAKQNHLSPYGFAKHLVLTGMNCENADTLVNNNLKRKIECLERQRNQMLTVLLAFSFYTILSLIYIMLYIL